MIKHLVFSALAVLALAHTADADTPAYRASWTGTGADPSVTISPQTGDAILVFVTSSGHNSTSDDPVITDNQSGSWNDPLCGSVWKQGSKWAPLHMRMRDQLAANGNSMTISADTQGKNGAIVAVAVSGLALWSSAPPLHGCGIVNFGSDPIGNVRMVKTNLYCINCNGDNPIESGTTPSVPKPFTQGAAFASTSLTLAVLANEETSPGVTAPSGWTQRSTVSTTSQGKTVALSLTSRDSGFSGTTVTWGSTTPTDGTGIVVELQPLQ